MGIKTPRLIQDRCGVFYFRWIVPLSWRPTVGKTEIRRSLRTKDAAIARQSALLLSIHMEALMAASKRGEPGSTPVPPEVQRIFDGLTESAGQAYKTKVRIFADGRAEIEADTLEEAKEARAMVEAHAKARIAEAEAGRGAKKALSLLPSSLCGTRLKQAAADYVEERRAALSETGTIPKIKGALKAFAELAGDIDVAMASSATVLDYKKKMLAEKKAGTTVNDHIGALVGFFDWCIDNKIARMDNPAKGMQIVGAHSKAVAYKPYSDDELASIFAPGPYLKRMKLPDFYWGPLIALWSGARAEEVASLELRQIRQEKGIWIIDIEKGKTENAVRKVPVHSKLLELGLVEHRDAMAAAGHKQLFPHLTAGKNGFRKNMCRMFGVHLDSPEVGIVDSLKVFHSFRHTAVTKLTSEGVNDGLKKALVGHDLDSRDTAHDGYIHGEGLTLPNLRKAIEKLDFPTVDAAALRLPADHFLPAVAKRIAQAKASRAKAAAKPRKSKQATAARIIVEVR